MSLSSVALMSLLQLIAMLRIAELLFSYWIQQKAKQHHNDVQTEPIYKWMVLLHSSVFVLVPWEVYWFERPWFPVLGILCFLGIVAALVGRVWLLRTLGSNWNVRILKPQQVISTGPYHYVRHPNYTIVILELIFIPLFHTAWLSALLLTLLNGVILFFRIRQEEAMLMSLPEYQKHMQHKPRFFPKDLFSK